MPSLARVILWGTEIGVVSMSDGEQVARFQYAPEYVGRGVEVAPLVMPLASREYRFAQLAQESFHGLPGLLADSLPDRYGQSLIATWLARQGRDDADFNAVERLCYIGRRGMGALEFVPATGPSPDADHELEIGALVELASEVLADRHRLVVSLREGTREQAMRDILAVGTSAGGARAKAVIAWNPATGVVRSGQPELPAGFEHWLLKFDGVSGNRDKETVSDPQGFCAIEYAYALMAADAGITMSECRLLDEGPRRHFLTRRFDRGPNGAKLHMQSLGALTHLDYNQPGASAYEQAFSAMRALGLDQRDVEQMFRRMVFNVIARNQDDHVKNIAFLMDRDGQWSLAPAFDLTYAYAPSGIWTSRHQMSVAGKRDGFTRADIVACGRTARLPSGRAGRILDEITGVVGAWEDYAGRAGVPQEHIGRISPALRLGLPHD